MSIWSRFRDVMKANVNSLLERSNDPERDVQTYIRSMNSDLGQIKAEATAVLAEQSRAERALNENNAEIAKLQRYAEKSVQAGEEQNAMQFLQKKAILTAKHAELQAAYERAAAKVETMKLMQTKLVDDLARLEARYTELKSRIAQAHTMQQNNEAYRSSRRAEESLQAMEHKAAMALNEAEALAELRSGSQEEDLDVLIARLEKGMNAQPDAAAAKVVPEQELVSLKQLNSGGNP
ncbi:PspA/IM30 family protein [Paenibacillus dauci]|uniref:PspA/IM30 family protein n=1 Tax=Paenibacillus dauci TaxID=1567106 RepID=UPI0006193D3D|nr:PspA/IM30 family protein [Paenibacillus dauci]